MRLPVIMFAIIRAHSALMPMNDVIPTNLINRLCAALDDVGNRSAFLHNEQAFCLRFGLNKEQRGAVVERDFLALVDAGAHLVFLDRLAALSGTNALQAIISTRRVTMDMAIARLLRMGPP